MAKMDLHSIVTLNRGKREKDIAVADINREQRWKAMVSAGCRITGIHWISEVLTTDDNTWISELQRNGKDTFEWKPAERETLRKRDKWSAWATHVKRLTKRAMEEVMEDSGRMELADEGSEDEGGGTVVQHWENTGRTLTPNLKYGHGLGWRNCSEQEEEPRW